MENEPIDPKTCEHEPDPATIVFDKKIYGRRALCIKCGHPISVVKIHRRPDEKSRPTMKITSSDKREAKRRKYALASDTESN